MRRLLILVLTLSSLSSFGQIRTERERAELLDEVMAYRFEHVLPEIMDKTEIDMWILISREYNEDPVLRTMLPPTWLNARRRTILVFYRDQEKDTLERMAVARYDVGKHIRSAWDKEKQPDQWARLNEIIESRTPSKIGLNISDHFGIADGLVQTDYEAFMQSLSEVNKGKIVSAEKLAIAWIETRTEPEMKIYEELVEITHSIIDEAFSSEVIKPGTTTTDDVVWWMRQKVTDLGLETWFHPTIDVQRTDEPLKSHIYSFSKSKANEVIMPGDLMHCDFGITYLGLNTDCQQHAYVLHRDETAVPDFLKNAFEKGNRVQDILTGNMVAGITGNELLLKSLEQGRTEGLKPAIYTHPLGTYGHSAGTTIGMWDSQGGVPVNGDYPLHYNTVYAIELNTTVHIEAWNKDIRIMLEEAGYFGKEGFRYVNGRQDQIKPIHWEIKE